MNARPIPAKLIAARTGFSVRQITRLASQGKIPGAHQPCGRGGGWRFSLDQFEAWWKASEPKGQQSWASTGVDRSGGRVPSVQDENTGHRLKHRLKQSLNDVIANGLTSSTR
jgi:hypothetical protein